MAVSTSDASWHGDLRSGNGSMRIGPEGRSRPYTFASRFEGGDGASPEELVAAAHAGCYAMALSNDLASNGHTPDTVHATATVHMGPDPAGGVLIASIDLVVRARVPGLTEEVFQSYAQAAKTGCPISKLCAGTSITLDAVLEV